MSFIICFQTVYKEPNSVGGVEFNSVPVAF